MPAGGVGRWLASRESERRNGRETETGEGRGGERARDGSRGGEVWRSGRETGKNRQRPPPTLLRLKWAPVAAVPPLLSFLLAPRAGGRRFFFFTAAWLQEPDVCVAGDGTRFDHSGQRE